MKVKVKAVFRDKLHYSRLYQPGEVVDFDRERAENIVALGLGEPVKEAVKAKVETPADAPAEKPAENASENEETKPKRTYKPRVKKETE